MELLKLVLVTVALLSATACNSIATTPATSVVPAQSVSFIQPVDGATVTSPFLVKFGVSGMQVMAAGTMTPNTGHHHLLINADAIPAMAVIPMDTQHMHFGKGQTETMLDLKPGKYTLTMQFGNGAHQAYGPGMNQTIHITVQ